MPRELRYHDPGAFYHVIARGNQQQVIFHGDDYYLHYLELLQRYSLKFSVVIHAYALMNNHVHLLVQEGPEPLSKFMQGVQQSYTQYVNKRREQTGHIFQGRYKSLRVEVDEYLLALVRYIHLNPVKAGLVTDPAEYRWSSHRSYFSGRDDRLIQTAFINGMMAEHRGREIADYQLIAADIPLASLRTECKVVDQGDRDEPNSARTVPVSTIMQQVEAHTGIPAAEIMGRSRSDIIFQARWLFIYVAAEEGYSVTELARFLSRGASTITMALNKIGDELRQGGAWTHRVAEFHRSRE